jgi:hypothetical protein
LCTRARGEEEHEDVAACDSRGDLPSRGTRDGGEVGGAFVTRGRLAGGNYLRSVLRSVPEQGNVEATDTLTGQVSSGSLHALALATVLSILGIVGLYGTLVAHSGRPDALAVSGASLAALSAVSLLALFAYITAGSLGWLWPLQEIGMGAYALGLLLVGTSAFRARLFGRLRALPLVVASLWPASIGLLLLWDRSGLVVLRTELISAPCLFSVRRY